VPRSATPPRTYLRKVVMGGARLKAASAHAEARVAVFGLPWAWTARQRSDWRVIGHREANGGEAQMGAWRSEGGRL